MGNMQHTSTATYHAVMQYNYEETPSGTYLGALLGGGSRTHGGSGGLGGCAALSASAGIQQHGTA
jgi:hypothetical protein